MSYFPNHRIHTGPQFQGHASSDFWVVATQSNAVAAASATNPEGLSGWGWTTTALNVTQPTSGDFLSAADSTPATITFGASADALSSARIFGDYAHGLVAKAILGYMPTRLCLEAYLQWPTATANENGSFFGFAGIGTTDSTVAGSVASIMSDGTNFRLKTGSAGNDAGAAIDNSFHVWKIAIDATNTEWFIDGTSQGTVTTVTDQFPIALRGIVTTTNRMELAWAHIWYE